MNVHRVFSAAAEYAIPQHGLSVIPKLRPVGSLGSGHWSVSRLTRHSNTHHTSSSPSPSPPPPTPTTPVQSTTNKPSNDEPSTPPPPAHDQTNPNPSLSPSPNPLGTQLRAVMRHLAHSVVVCTAAAPRPRAMTMSSFTSLSLDPAPVVTFNMARPSRTLDAVVAARRFAVHVLAAGDAGARVAACFTAGNARDAGPGAFAARAAADAGCAVVLLGGDAPVPVLRGPGVLYALRCRLLDAPAAGLVEVRDHVIVLGEVEEIVEGEAAEADGFGLVYADRRYRQLGGSIDLPQKDS